MTARRTYLTSINALAVLTLRLSVFENIKFPYLAQNHSSLTKFIQLAYRYQMYITAEFKLHNIEIAISTFNTL